jgi:hypothetical protein
MLKTLRVSNINDNYYNDDAFDSSAEVSGEAGEVHIVVGHDFRKYLQWGVIRSRRLVVRRGLGRPQRRCG